MLSVFLSYHINAQKAEQATYERLDFTGRSIDLNILLKEPESVRTLLMDSCNLSELPEEIMLLTELQHISLGSNPQLDYSQVCKQLSKNKKLKFINLSNNRLTHLPSNLSLLQSLGGIRLSHNKLESGYLGETLVKLPKLKRLWVDNNQLGAFPSKLLTMPCLRFLYLYNNQISSIVLPSNQSNKLWVLHLGSNQFDTLPETLTAIKNLRMAMFNQNRITRIPEAFAKGKYTLNALILDHNSLSQKERRKTEKYFGKMMMFSNIQKPY